MRTHKVIILNGDGIGPELVDAAMRVLAAVQEADRGFTLDLDYREGGAGCYRKYGVNLAPGTLDAIKQAARRLKLRYREILRSEIASTVGSTDDVDAELRELMNALS